MSICTGPTGTLDIRPDCLTACAVACLTAETCALWTATHMLALHQLPEPDRAGALRAFILGDE